MHLINQNVIFVKGAKRGAIYDFDSGKVYSTNEEGCRIIEDYIRGNKIHNEYISELIKNGLIDLSFSPIQYTPSLEKNINLNLAWLEITNACNMKCIHCYEGGSHKKLENSLVLDEWFAIIDSLSNLKVQNIILIGGEPTFSPYVNQLLKYISKFDIKTTLFTNATNISEELFSTILRTKPYVKISVYGHTAKLHDSITQINGSFDKMVANIKRLKDAEIDVTSSIVIMKENEEYLDEIIDFVKRLGMNYYRHDFIRNVYGGTQNLHAPVMDVTLKKAFFTKPNFKTSKKRFDAAILQNTCWYGKVAIKENGDVIPCEFERDFIYGNVKKHNLCDIINSPRTLDKWFMDFSKIEGCKDCEYRYACKDCRPLGISICGSMTSKNPRCLYDPYKGEWGELPSVVKMGGH